jgi:hypothetical protein
MSFATGKRVTSTMLTKLPSSFTTCVQGNHPAVRCVCVHVGEGGRELSTGPRSDQRKPC